MEIKIGADPEFFLVDSHGNAVPAVGLVPGTKKNPYPLDKGAVQVDGLAVEFNIHPAETEDEFVNNIKTVLAQVRNIVPKELSFKYESTMSFREDVFSTLPKENLVLGCDPDYNAYTRAVNPAYDAKLLGTYRMAGGHVHVGWTENADVRESQHFMCGVQLVTQLDFFLGMPFRTLVDNDIRRDWYGRAGNFRPKPYGVEYRTLSNIWLQDEKYMRFVFRNTQRAFDFLVNKDMDYDRNWPGDGRRYINYNGSGQSAADWLSRETNIIQKEDLDTFTLIKHCYNLRRGRRAA